MTVSKFFILNKLLTHNVRLFLLWGGAVWIVMHASLVNASEGKNLNILQIHGFLSQGYVNTLGSNNDVFGDSSRGRGSFDFREIGVNASYRPLTNLQFSGQLLSRQAGEDSKGGIRVDYGFVDYTAFTTETRELGIRLGRTKNPLGLYNDTRDVPFTRPSILLPQSIYFDRTRNLGLASDGAQFYGESREEWGDITVQFGVVFPQVGDRATEWAILNRDRLGHLTTRLSYIGRMIYERDGGRIRLGISGAQVNVGYDSAANLNDPLNEAGSFQFTPIIFSAQYNTERWSFTSEYALRHIMRKDFGSALGKVDTTGESFYFQGIYRFSPSWEAVLRYDVYFADRSDRDGGDFFAQIQQAAPQLAKHYPAYSRYAKDLTVGLRWNVTPSIMLRAEYHHVNGTGWLSQLDNRHPVRPDFPAFTDRHWNLFAFQASYRF
ncbi:hypothetical protein [Nitrosomonas nitrosa]|uniref:hypothetical protein n=1 Tax=Nitrosomonas nitrosa TaxID=52442 RepID=UPI0023FA34C1|nr:hypothetical protein [Nitrosomonas nitrosa]MCO6434282.1 hypothetical protein [Nitrosomonas nitrosa]